MARRTRKAKPAIWQLRISLKEISPPVWRRVLVTSTDSLASLHATLNEAMGWTNSHLHQFDIARRTFGDPSIDEEGEFEDERDFALEEVASVGDRFLYAYDFGDGWEHVVEVEKALTVDERWVYPVCIGGANACPPEDCGGPAGYERLVEALASDEDTEDLVTWIGGFFDPKGFDVNRTNQALRSLVYRD